MVEGSIGALGRTDGHDREVQVLYGVGGDRGGNGVLLPLLIGLPNEYSSSDETKADNNTPENLR